MASITSLSNSNYNTSSIYGNRNVLSGLASGMDTETMIENAVYGYKLKIQNLQKRRTKIEWQQEAYRSIIDKAVNFNQKYTSYASKTNLMSNSFFTNAVNSTALGTYKDKVTATGKTSSDIKLNAVKQMAAAASYTVSGLGGLSKGEIGAVSGDSFSITGDIPVSTVSGSLSFQYGGKNGASFDISFDELENLNDVKVYDADGNEKTDASSGEKLAQAIRNKLGEITYNYTKNGFKESTTADKAIQVDVDPFGRITFSDALGEGNAVKISSSTGDIADYAGEQVITAPGDLTEDTKAYQYLADKELGFTFNGSTKKINLGDVISATDVEGANADQEFVENLQKELDDAFGKGKIEASYEDGKLSFTPQGKGDVLTLGGSALEGLGFESGDANYINASKKLTDILGDRAGDMFSEANRLKGTGDITARTSPNGNTYYLDSKGNRVDEDGYRVDENGKALYDFAINGAHIGVTEDTTLESLMNSINSNAEAGMKVSYSKLTNEFKFTATETGANSRVEFGGLAKDLFASHDRTAQGSFAETYGITLGNKLSFDIEGVGEYSYNNAFDENSTIQDVVDRLNRSLNRNHQKTASFDELSGQIIITDDKTGKSVDFKMLDAGGSEYELPEFGSSYTHGQDAIMDVEVNGVRFEDFTRSGNTFDIDGMNITVKGEFTTGEDEEAVTFQTTTDSDKIVEAVASMINDYNEMVTELKSAYSTLPAQKSNGAKYDPLTAEQEEEYSESELKAYNEKAKQGILFGDSTLSSMYSKLLSSVAPGGTDGQTLREIGITTSYSDGLTTLSLDEDKLRAALDSDPDKVRNAFTKTTESGSASNGLMQSLQNNLNTYVKNTGEPKGILISRAGSIKAPTSLNSNSLQSQMNSIDNQIERWQNKMSDQIDRYTTKFSRLEQLIAEMNSQASSLSSLMGGSSGY